jgi:vacuolar-type H+-ATPase subunit E/Vma4
MEAFGNIEGLKKAIQQKYSLKIREVEKERDKELKSIEKDLKKALKLQESRMKTNTDAAAKKTYSMILSSEKLKAKKEFEEKREALIEAVFRNARKQARTVAHSREYVDFVAKNAPKEPGIIIKGDAELYKQTFPELHLDESLLGIKFVSEGVIYDFTLDNMIDSKKDILRQEVSNILFG